jgi:hypothetical protein
VLNHTECSACEDKYQYRHQKHDLELFTAAKRWETSRKTDAAGTEFRRVILHSEARFSLSGLVESIGGPLTSEEAKRLRTLLHAIIDTYGDEP